MANDNYLRNQAQDLEIYGFVYLITNTINQKKYVGLTSKSVWSRWLAHGEASSLANGMRITRAILKHGREAFTVQVIGWASSPDQLDAFEKQAISYYKSAVPTFGYNSMSGGQIHRVHSESTKELISIKKKGYKYGPEFGAKISKALIGKPKSKEHVEKVAAANRGKRLSEAQILAHIKSKTAKYGKGIKATSPTGEATFYKSIRECTRATGLYCRTLINKICKGQAEAYLGWTFEYSEVTSG